MKKDIISAFLDHCQVIERASQHLSESIEDVSQVIVGAFLAGNKVLILGNGGSAADAQHFAAELVGRFKAERRAFPAISLSDNVSNLTAIGNDYGFEKVFQRQIDALACPGDVVIGISTSGQSENIFLAMQTAHEKGCQTLGFLGRDGGRIAGIVDWPLVVASEDTPRIQEAHITIIHICCDLIEQQLIESGVFK